MSTSNRSLAQTLAVQSQVHLPGTVGRLLKQIRDLERVAPLFVKAGLVRAVERPNPISTWASGIATQALTTRTIGGFLYGAAAVRCDLLVEHNAISTAGQDSACEIDDINYENQSKRLALAAIRQAYTLADRAVAEERGRLIFFDTPLLMDRGMVPPANRAGDEGYKAAYEATLNAIEFVLATASRATFPVERDWPGDHRPCVGALWRNRTISATGPSVTGGPQRAIANRGDRPGAARRARRPPRCDLRRRRAPLRSRHPRQLHQDSRIPNECSCAAYGARISRGAGCCRASLSCWADDRAAVDAARWRCACLDPRRYRRGRRHNDGAHSRWRCAVVAAACAVGRARAESARTFP